MTDWRRVIGFEKHSYVQSFPVTSFLLVGVTNYQETIIGINIGDILDMSHDEQNAYDKTAIIVKRSNNTCGFVSKDEKEKVQPHVPSKVKVIDKRLYKNNYSLRVDIIRE
jgi:chemotaxis signal transduction protein